MKQWKQKQENLLLVATCYDNFLYSANLEQLIHHYGKWYNHHPIRTEEECRSHSLILSPDEGHANQQQNQNRTHLHLDGGLLWHSDVNTMICNIKPKVLHISIFLKQLSQRWIIISSQANSNVAHRKSSKVGKRLEKAANIMRSRGLNWLQGDRAFSDVPIINATGEEQKKDPRMHCFVSPWLSFQVLRGPWDRDVHRQERVGYTSFSFFAWLSFLRRSLVRDRV